MNALIFMKGRGSQPRVGDARRTTRGSRRRRFDMLDGRGWSKCGFRRAAGQGFQINFS